MDIVPDYVSAYLSKWGANIIEYVSTIGNQICLSDLTIQHLASYYGHSGGKGKALAGKVKVFTGFLNKWREHLASAKTFIDTKERMPKKIAGAVEERRLGIWIANNKRYEGGTNSEREQLMMREIPLTFVDNSHPV